jgi:hypothetical protein
MANREITYYSLLSSENLRHIEQTADTMDERSFVTLGFEQKWLHHLWIGANNEAFLERISHQTGLNKLDMILGEQLKLYARKQGEGYEQDKGDFYGTYRARKDWLKHTIFICTNEYNKTQNEVFNEVGKWCVDWKIEWLETFNPYNPTERKEMSEHLKTPLWEQLNEGEPNQQTDRLQPELKEALKTFDELFYNAELVEPCINILKELEPPLIDTDCNYIGRLKGVICVWVDEMQRQGIIKHQSDRKVFASLIPLRIKRFSIDESMFGKHHSKAETNYRTDIKIKVSAIKPSHDSQKGKQGK